MNLRYAEWFEMPVLGKDAEIEWLPLTVQQWKVDFDVVLDGWVIGTDHGLLWVDKQNLYVVGRHTSFAIPGHRLKHGLKNKLQCLRPLERPFYLQIETGSDSPLALQFELSSEAPTEGEKGVLRAAIEECRAASSPETEGQLPPRTPFTNAQTLQSYRRPFWPILLIPAITCIMLLFIEEEGLTTAGSMILFLLYLSGSAIFFPRFTLVRAAMVGRKRYYARLKARQATD